MMMKKKREKKLKKRFRFDGGCVGERELSVKCWGLFSICAGWDLLRPWKGYLVTNVGGNTQARLGFEQSNMKLGI